MTAALAGLLPLAGCDDDHASPDAVTSRQGEYEVSSIESGDAIDSQIYRAGELVAVASVTPDDASVTWLASGVEVVSEAPEKLDLDAYQASLGDISRALELQAAATSFRNSGCGYSQWTGGLGQVCISSWCNGTACYAVDCAPDANGCGEVHYISLGC